MAWGMGKPDGNKGGSCRQAPPFPQAFNIGPLDITVQQRRTLYLRHRDVYRFEHSSGRVRSLKATALRCLEASYPSGREAIPTGQNPCAETLERPKGATHASPGGPPRPRP